MLLYSSDVSNVQHTQASSAASVGPGVLLLKQCLRRHGAGHHLTNKAYHCNCSLSTSWCAVLLACCCTGSARLLDGHRLCACSATLYCEQSAQHSKIDLQKPSEPAMNQC